MSADRKTPVVVHALSLGGSRFWPQCSRLRERVRTLSFALLALGTVAAPRAWALPPIDVEAGFGDQIVTARSFDLVSEQDHLLGWRLSAAIQPIARWPRLWLELDDLFAGTQAQLHEAGAADLTLHDLGLSALYRRPVAGPFSAFVRVGPRLAVGNLAILDGNGNTLAGQWQSVPGAGATVGLEIPFTESRPDKNTGRVRSFGVRGEIGYVWFPDFQFNAVTPPPPPGTSNPKPISSAPTSVGPLASSGIFADLALFLRF